MTTVEVRIRTSEDSKSLRLCDWDADKLDALIPLIGGWGLTTDYGSYDQSSLAGQFVLTDQAAFFEVVAELEDGT